MKVREIHIPLFESHVFVFWGCKPIEVAKYIKKNLRGFPPHFDTWMRDNNEKPPRGVCLSDYGNSASCIIWLNSDPAAEADLLVHEVAHAVHRIMKHWSIELDENSQEMFAMLMGFIVKETLKIKR